LRTSREGLGSAPMNVVVESVHAWLGLRQVSSILGLSACCRDPHAPPEHVPETGGEGLCPLVPLTMASMTDHSASVTRTPHQLMLMRRSSN